MAITPEESGVFHRRPPSTPAVDADAAYLEKLGYKQELNRSLGLFSAFGVQFTSIAIASGIFTTLVVGIGFFGPAAFWSFLVGGALQVFTVGLAVAMLVSSYPLAGGVYQITGRITGKPWLAWQTGWWLLIAHTVAVTACSVSIAPFIAGWFGVTFENAVDALPWTLGLIVLATIINIAGVKVAALLNNIGVVAECVCVFGLIGVLVFVKHPTQPLAFLTDSGGTATGGHWFVPFLFAMILPAYAISSFDATGNASEETKNAALKAPLASVLANVSSYVVGVVMVGMLMLAIQDLPTIMGSALPVKDILNTAVGSAFANVFEAVAIVALFAAVVMLQLTGIRVLWSQARDGQIPAASWMRKVSKQRIPINATLTIFALSVVFALWSSLLSVLTAMTALAWGLAYGVVVTVGLYALLKKKLPQHPWHYGKLSPVIFVLAIAWSAVLCTLLVYSDPIHVGLGMVMVIGAGAVIYMTIPKSRRGKSIDTQTGHL
ncbi:APC family permease [Mycolicibacterium brisbanense]|uniref:Amino acid permease family protein n=1 Tax=Mycolicibacterium brisbanense TaxID=146020 RepID=A0A100VW64_9MYCO|nr:amino acid permease [Mycolicibacterium brisbanense]MCV7159634.1 amino acid permease [Mycolicibacterium brisbanense]GAS87142.1 amino acid permease family protein [Mycolicibacterium brisbanense]